MPNGTKSDFTKGHVGGGGAMVTLRLVLPVYLVLPAGANRSQTINLIKENNGWPHQVSLIKSKHRTKECCSVKKRHFEASFKTI